VIRIKLKYVPPRAVFAFRYSSNGLRLAYQTGSDALATTVGHGAEKQPSTKSQFSAIICMNSRAIMDHCHFLLFAHVVSGLDADPNLPGCCASLFSLCLFSMDRIMSSLFGLTQQVYSDDNPQLPMVRTSPLSFSGLGSMILCDSHRMQGVTASFLAIRSQQPSNSCSL
jgi:hypothetical protein